MTTDARKALLVIDCQNDFADPDGSLYVEGAEQVIAQVNRLIIETVAAGQPVFYTQDWHPESTPHFAKDGGIWPEHCVGGTWGSDFYPRLIVAGPSVRKGANGEDGYSGFTMRDPTTGEEIQTELHELLQAEGVTVATVVGLALDYCVKATALDAVTLGYSTALAQEATAAVNLEQGDGDAALAELSSSGVALA